MRTRTSSSTALAALCVVAAAGALSACNRNTEVAPPMPAPSAPMPSTTTPMPPADPNDPTRRRSDPNSVPPAMQPAPGAPVSPPSPGGSTTQ